MTRHYTMAQEVGNFKPPSPDENQVGYDGRSMRESICRAKPKARETVQTWPTSERSLRGLA